MKATSYIKKHQKDEFIIKTIKRRGVTYWLVIDTYDQSQASLELSEESAVRMANELNKMRNNRVNL